MNSERPRSKVPSADATLEILALLARHTRPIAASRIASSLGLPRSSTYDLLGVLVERQFVIHYEQDRAYGMGPAAYELSSAYTRQAPLAILGRRVADGLVRELGESVHVAVLDGRDVLYVVEARAPRRPSLVTDVGVRLPAHVTATGRSLLAALPVAQVHALYDGEGSLEARVLAEAKDTRARGYAVEDGEVTPGLSSVAVAVPDRSGWPMASIAVTYGSGPLRGIDELRAAAAMLRDALA